MGHPEQFNQIIRTRRTVKPADFAPEEIPREVIEAILENANWAPNHGKTEPWRFRVYSGAARADLADTLTTLYERTTPPDQRRADKLEKLDKNPRRASHAIAIFLQRFGGLSGCKIPEIEEIEAVACAVQNMQLTAHAYGLGAFWSTGPMTYSDEASRVFDLEPDWQYLGILFLGTLPETFARDGVRKPIANKTQWMGA